MLRRILAAAAGRLVNGGLQVRLEGPQQAQLALRFSSGRHVRNGREGSGSGVWVGGAGPSHQPSQLWRRGQAMWAADGDAQRLGFGAAQVDGCQG